MGGKENGQEVRKVRGNILNGTVIGIIASILFLPVCAEAAASLESRLSFSSSILVPGQWVQIRLTVTNTGGSAATDLFPENQVFLGDAKVEYISGPVPSGLLSLAPASSTTFVWTYSISGYGVIAFTATATGTDSSSLLSVSTASSGSIYSVTPAILEPILLVYPSTVYPGDAIILTMTVTNSGGSSANLFASGTPWISGAVPAGISNGPTPSFAMVPGGGGSRTFTWVYTAGSAPGGITFSVSVNGIDAVSGGQLTTGMLTAGPVTVLGVAGACPLSAVYMKTFDRFGQDDRGFGIAVGQSGSVFLAEQKDFYAFGQGINTRTARYGTSGSINWEYSFTSPGDIFDASYAVARDPATGTIYTGGVTDNSLWVAALGSEGNELWKYFITPTSGTAFAEARGIAVDSSGNAYVTGKVPRPDLLQDDNLILLKYDKVGTTLWTSWYNSAANLSDEGFGVAVDPTGSFVYVAGYEDRTDLGQGRNILILKYDAATGAQLLKWSYASPGNGDDEGRGITVDSFGDVYVGGFETRADYGQGKNGWIAKYSPAGTLLWKKTFNGPVVKAGGPEDIAYGIAISPGRELYVIGQQEMPGTRTDVTLRRYDLNGNLREAIAENGDANREDAGTAVGFDARGDIYATGWMIKSLSQVEDVWLKKYLSPVCMQSALTVTPNPASLGGQITVVMSVTNSGGTVINGLTPAIEVGPGAGLVSLFSGPTPANATLNPGEYAEFTWVYDTLGTGTVILSATATGIESVTGMPLEIYASGSLLIKSAAAISGALFAPMSVCGGNWFQVRMTVTNTGETNASGLYASSTLFFEGGTGVEMVTRPAPLALLAGGASHTFTWTVSAWGAGILKFTATASGSDSASGLAITTGPVVSGTMGFGSQSILSAHISGPSVPVPVGDWFTVEMTVSNTGGGDATGQVRPLALSPPGALVALISGPVPSGLVAIPAGGVQSFSWTYSVSGGGRVTFTATFSGSDFCRPAILVSSTVGVDAGLPALLEASALTVSPDPVCVGSLLVAVLTVTNTGQVAANNVRGSTSLYIEGSAILLVSPAMLSSLAPGASTRLTWTYSATAAGSLKFTASVSGVDSRAGTPLMAIPSPSNVITVSQAAILSASSSIPAQAVLGQWVTVTLTVTNTGGQNAVAVRPYASATLALSRTVSGPSPAGPVTLAPGVAQTFSWTYSVSGRGSILFTLSASGTTCAGSPVSGKSTGILVAKTPAQLAILSFALSPSTVNLAGPFNGSLVVKNMGEASATLKGYSLTVTGLVLPIGSSSLPDPALAGGASFTILFTFTTDGASCGSALARASVDGLEDLSGICLHTGTAVSNVVSLTGTPTGLVFISPPATIKTVQPATLTVLARDSCMQAVSGYPVYFAVTQGLGTLSSPSVSTDSSGYARIILTAPLEPDSESVMAYLDGTLISTTVILDAVNPLALSGPGAALDKNSFVPSNGEFVLARVRPKAGSPVEDIQIKVFTASGRLVKYLIAREAMGMGQWTVKWDGTTEEGYVVARGVYLVYVNGGGIREVLKVVVK